MASSTSRLPFLGRAFRQDHPEQIKVKSQPAGFSRSREEARRRREKDSPGDGSKIVFVVTPQCWIKRDQKSTFLVGRACDMKKMQSKTPIGRSKALRKVLKGKKSFGDSIQCRVRISITMTGARHPKNHPHESDSSPSSGFVCSKPEISSLLRLREDFPSHVQCDEDATSSTQVWSRGQTKDARNQLSLFLHTHTYTLDSPPMSPYLAHLSLFSVNIHFPLAPTTWRYKLSV